VIWFILALQSSFAENTFSDSACRVDMDSHCSKVEPKSQEKVFQCLSSKEKEISSDCQRSKEYIKQKIKQRMSEKAAASKSNDG
jgi:hypothetical protein